MKRWGVSTKRLFYFLVRFGKNDAEGVLVVKWFLHNFTDLLLPLEYDNVITLQIPLKEYE